MRRALQGMILIVALLAWHLGCAPSTSSDGDGDGDVDVDSDADGDGDGAPDSAACPPEAECCEDAECSNGVYCDGVEVCDRGRCEQGLPIDCDDDVSCTADNCDEARNLCVHAPVHTECDDGDVCSGDERCEPSSSEAGDDGCVPGAPVRCDDGDACTDDFCEEGECQVRVRDSDGDGHGDQDCAVCDPEDPTDCERGDDCNDADPTVYPGAVEVCDDGEDNDCDRLRDYAEEECVVPNDGCAEAVRLEEGVVAHSSTRGTVGDIDTACGVAGDRDVAFYFIVPAEQDAEIAVASLSSELTLSLTSACGDPLGEVRCQSGRAFSLYARALPAGTYYVVATTPSEVDFDVTVHLSDPVAAPPGDLCVDAIDVTGGGTFSGTTTGMLPDYESNCGDATDLDVAYTFTLSSAQSMDIDVTAGAGPVAVALQQACGVVASERGCFTADPMTDRHYRSVEPGTWYLIFKSEVPDDFDFSLSFGAPDPGVPFNFIALPWDFFGWDAEAASVLYRAVTYGFGGHPLVGAVSEGADTTGSTSSSNPVASGSTGEFGATVAALEYGGLPPGNVTTLADQAAAEAALGSYDVLLFMEFERGAPSSAAWLPTIESHLSSGGRVVTACGSSNGAFFDALGIFGSGSTTGTSTAPYTVASDTFWDGATTMTSTDLNASWAWTWTGAYLTPLAWRTSSATALMVWGYDVP